MSRTIFCSYTKQEDEGLDRAPLPGPLGQKIFDNISKPAWRKWLAHQTLLINENRLSPINPEHRKYLEQQAEAFLFGGDVDKAVGFVDPTNGND